MFFIVHSIFLDFCFLHWGCALYFVVTLAFFQWWIVFSCWIFVFRMRISFLFRDLKSFFLPCIWIFTNCSAMFSLFPDKEKGSTVLFLRVFDYFIGSNYAFLFSFVPLCIFFLFTYIGTGTRVESGLSGCLIGLGLVRVWQIFVILWTVPLLLFWFYKFFAIWRQKLLKLL